MDPNRSSALHGVMWAVLGAVVALAAVYALGIGRQQAASTPVAASGPTDELRARIDALERAEAERLKRNAAPAPVAPARVEPAPPAQPPLAVAPPPAPARPSAAAKPKPAPRAAQKPAPRVEAPPPAPVFKPEPAPATPSPPPPVALAPRVTAPTSAETLANADRLIARGAYAEAVAALQPLAERDNARAQVRLADLYLEGRGVARNETEGLRLMRRAATQGDGEAQFKMGELYARGNAVQQNNFQAYIWYNAASRRGYPGASAAQERIGATLQPVEIEQAAKLGEKLAQAGR